MISPENELLESSDYSIDPRSYCKKLPIFLSQLSLLEDKNKKNKNQTHKKINISYANCIYEHMNNAFQIIWNYDCLTLQ